MSAQAACSFCARTVRHERAASHVQLHPVLSTCVSNNIDELGSDNHMSQPQFDDSSGTSGCRCDFVELANRVSRGDDFASALYAVTRLHREGPPFRLKITFTETTREDRPYRGGLALVGSQTGFTEAAWRMHPQ